MPDGTLPGTVGRLVNELERLPGIGPKTAQRLAFYLLTRPAERAFSLANAIKEARERVRYCSTCLNLTEEDPCSLCSDPRRDPTVICVVQEPRDVVAMEKTHEFRGLYHVLHGAISPLDGLGPNDLHLQELLQRVAGGAVTEVILATNPNVEGEATALYLGRLLQPLVQQITRIAHGLPVGGDLEFADQVTLARALEGRREFRP